MVQKVACPAQESLFKIRTIEKVLIVKLSCWPIQREGQSWSSSRLNFEWMTLLQLDTKGADNSIMKEVKLKTDDISIPVFDLSGFCETS